MDGHEFSRDMKVVIMSRVPSYLSESKFRVGLCRHVFENMNEINLDGFKRTSAMKKVADFVDILFMIVKGLKFENGEELVPVLNAISGNLDPANWAGMMVESEKYGQEELGKLWALERELVDICIEQVIGILIQLYLRIAGDRQDILQFCTENLQTILLNSMESSDKEGEFVVLSEENSMKLIIVILDFLKSKEEKISFLARIEPFQCYRGVIKSNVHSANSEKRKLSFIFFDKFSELVEDERESFFLKGCNNLSSTLDSYGIHLISVRKE